MSCMTYGCAAYFILFQWFDGLIYDFILALVCMVLWKCLILHLDL